MTGNHQPLSPLRTRAESRPRGLAKLALWASVALSLAPAVRAQEESVVLRLRAQRLAAQGHCEDAIPLLRRVREQTPGDARAALLEGTCAIQLSRYTKALAPLKRARQLGAEPGEPDLYLAIAYYHLGDFARAASALEGAEAAIPERAEVHLYRGLLLLRQEKHREAAAELERAGTLDPDAVEPVASYYAGLAWQSAKDRARAQKALSRVQERAPGTAWAERALERSQEREKLNWWASLSAGLEYNDNVVLRGRGVELPANISGTDDVGGLWSLDAGAELWHSGDWTAGLGASYDGSAYSDLSDFNLQSPGVRAWLDRKLTGPLLARLEADLEYTWLDGDKYVASYGATGLLFADLDDASSGRAFVRFARSNFLSSPPSTPRDASLTADQARTARNRDGNEVTIGLDYWRELGSVALVNGSYRFQHYYAEGSEYSYNSHELSIGLRRALPFDVILDVSASVELRRYENPSTFPDPPGSGSLENSARDEQTYQVDVQLERPITRWLTGSIYYTHWDNVSNVDVYDYDQNIVGFLLTVRLPR